MTQAAGCAWAIWLERWLQYWPRRHAPAVQRKLQHAIVCTALNGALAAPCIEAIPCTPNHAHLSPPGMHRVKAAARAASAASGPAKRRLPADVHTLLANGVRGLKSAGYTTFQELLRLTEDEAAKHQAENGAGASNKGEWLPTGGMYACRTLQACCWDMANRYCTCRQGGRKSMPFACMRRPAARDQT